MRQRNRRSAMVKLALMSLLASACSCTTAEERVREPAYDGRFYPAERSKLSEMVEHFLAEGAKKATLAEAPIALIAPHAGYQFSGRCAGVAYAAVKGRAYRRVVALALSHRGGFRGGSILDVDAYLTPLGKVPLDRPACDKLLRSKLFADRPPADRNEHSLEVQVPFLQAALGPVPLVPVVIGHLEGDDAATMAAGLRKVVDNDTLVVASSDFTHYGEEYEYVPFRDDIRAKLEKLDLGAIDLICQRDADGFAGYLRRTGATVCGRNPIAVLLHLLPEKATGRLLNYYTSGDATGSYRQSVSYAAIAFTAPGQWGRPAGSAPEKEPDTPAAKPEGASASPPEPDPKAAKPSAPPTPTPTLLGEASKRKLLEVARNALVAAAADRPQPQVKLDDAELQGTQGVFVTLKRGGQLRGCLGNFEPTTPLYQTVAAQARDSALKDWRFPRVHPDEVPDIRIEISVLLPARPIRNPLDWELGRHGIIVRRGMRQATFLPQVAESFSTREEMLSECCKKAGLPPQIWRDPETSVLIYEAIVFAERPRRAE